MTYVLDTWAVVELLLGSEEAGQRVAEVLVDRPVMSWINLGELFYVVRRDRGEDEAIGTIRDLRHRIEVELPSEERILAAARLKSDHRMSYADAFAAATAIAHDATLLTGDPELTIDGAPWRWEDLRL